MKIDVVNGGQDSYKSELVLDLKPNIFDRLYWQKFTHFWFKEPVRYVRHGDIIWYAVNKNNDYWPVNNKTRGKLDVILNKYLKNK